MLEATSIACKQVEAPEQRASLTSAVSFRSATLADETPGCACKTRSTAEEQEAQCMPLTDT